MGRLTAFTFITLNGYYKGPNGDISRHRHGAEETEFSAQSLQAGNVLLFGRVTYELMAGYWPTSEAIKNAPLVAEGMNKADKIVFSRTLKTVEWNNTKLVKDDILAEIRKRKGMPGKNLTVLGSGSIVSLFAEQGLIDEYQIMIDPVVLSNGTPLFRNIKRKLDLKLTGTRTFKSGVVLLCYEPMEK